MADESPQDYTTGRPAKDEQMKAIKTAHGEPKRQNDYGPKIGEKALEGTPKEED